MRKMIMLLALILSVSTVYASDLVDEIAILEPLNVTSAVSQFEHFNLISSEKGCIALLKDEVLGQRGCCSHHGGVCGCSGGSVVCCDNTYSPSCTCRADGTIQN